MSNWLERRAIEDATIERDGPELWRTFRDTIQSVVDSFNAIYCERDFREFQCNDCTQASENCVRVRSIPPPGKKGRYIELRFKPERRDIALISVEGQKILFTFGISDTRKIQLLHENTPISVDAASKLVLEPFLFASGPRPPLKPPSK